MNAHSKDGGKKAAVLLAIMVEEQNGSFLIS